MNNIKISVRRFFPRAAERFGRTIDGWPLPQGRNERLLFSFLVATNHFRKFDFFADERYLKVLSVARRVSPPASCESRFPVWVLMTLPVPLVFHLLVYQETQRINAFRITHWIETGEFIGLDAMHILAFVFHVTSFLLLLWLTWGLYALAGFCMLFVGTPEALTKDMKAEALNLVQTIESQPSFSGSRT